MLKVMNQFQILASEAGLSKKQIERVHSKLLSNSEKVEALVEASFLNESVSFCCFGSNVVIVKSYADPRPSSDLSAFSDSNSEM